LGDWLNGDIEILRDDLNLQQYYAPRALRALPALGLGELYGTAVYHLLIRDDVPQAAQAPGGWAGVTFVNALDMATGYYQSAGDEIDENNPDYVARFIAPEDYATKLAGALAFPRRRAPGAAVGLSQL
jgi:hypothetical protein